jgi:hypothetical protein
MKNEIFVIHNVNDNLYFVPAEHPQPSTKRQIKKQSSYTLSNEGQVLKNRLTGKTYRCYYSWPERLRIFFTGKRY